MYSENHFNQPQEKTDEELYALLDSYRTQILEALKKVDDPKKIFPTFMTEVRNFLRKKELPKEIRDEIRSLVTETFDVIRELSPTMNVAEATDEDVAKKIIDDTKNSGEIILDTHRESETAVYKILTKDLLLEEILPDLVLPPGQCGYKGGVARVALKRYAQLAHGESFDASLLDAELPLSDKDAVVGPDEDMWKRSTEMGVDPDGMEKLKSFDVRAYMDTRDLDMNEALLTKEALYFTPDALHSVLTGVVHGRERGRSLFGADSFFREGKLYLTNRMIHRLIKAIIEGKAKSFELPEYNTEVRLGIYWLVLVRKAMGKKNQAQKIAGIFSCARQMKQTAANSPLEFIQELREKYPFFSFEANQSPTDIAKWVVSKYVALIHKHLRQRFHIHPGEWEYTSNNEALVNIHPDIEEIDLNGIDELVESLLPAQNISSKPDESLELLAA